MLLNLREDSEEVVSEHCFHNMLRRTLGFHEAVAARLYLVFEDVAEFVVLTGEA